MYAIVHHIPGRLRLKRSPLRGNQPEAARIGALLMHCEGVHRSHVSTVTGSIVIHYDPALTTIQAILAVLNLLPVIEGTTDRPPPLSPAHVVPALAPLPLPAKAHAPSIVAQLSATFGKMILEMAVEKLVERSVFVLVKALV
ncbi:MAG: hypothetical protein U1F76_22440 [Candidatus Competibacteraceae bacterium]